MKRIGIICENKHLKWIIFSYSRIICLIFSYFFVLLLDTARRGGGIINLEGNIIHRECTLLARITVAPMDGMDTLNVE